VTATLTIRDETTFSFGGDDQGYALDVPTEHLTVRDLIRGDDPKRLQSAAQAQDRCGEAVREGDRVLLPQRFYGPGQ
jgi:hypothetical protein